MYSIILCKVTIFIINKIHIKEILLTIKMKLYLIKILIKNLT